jgi:hypothetical protein
LIPLALLALFERQPLRQLHPLAPRKNTEPPMSSLSARLVRISTLALAALSSMWAAAPRPASAVELYWDPAVTTVVSRPLVLTRPVTTSYYVAPIETTHTTTIDVTLNASSAIDAGPAGESQERDPYDTHGLVIAGAGMGGLFFFGDGITGVAAAYRLHVGLAIGPAEFALRFDLAPDAMEVARTDGGPGTTPAALYTAGATFNYRFIDGAVVHPVVGAGIETVTIDPHQAQGGTAFAATGRVGLELAYPISHGALALGLDVTGHHLFGASPSFGTMRDMMTFGAYADYRF